MPPSRRDDLIEASIEVFSKEGFRSVSVDRVLEVSGVSRMTLYNHFESKDDLMVTAFERWEERSRAALRERVEAYPAAERPLAVFDIYATTQCATTGRVCLALTAAIEYDDAACRMRELAAQHQESLVADLEGWLAGAGAGDPDLAIALLLLIQGALAATRAIGQLERASLRTEEIWSVAKGAAHRVIQRSG
ncbi:MAG: TetR/AcrR family transcriptional regulator [Planctomycetota bacterium]